MLKNEEEIISAEYAPHETEVVSDLLITLFLTMDEYVTYLSEHGHSVEDLTKMKNYTENVMRKYVKDVYQLEVEDI